MNILRNILAVIVGAFVGGAVNMSVIMAGSSVVSPPNGIDTSTMEGLLEAMPLMGPEHFLMPFLAHAIGTLVGAFLAALIASSYKIWFALLIGGLFLIGGVMMAKQLPSPLWFDATDILLAYIPMAWLGWRFAGAK